MIILLFLIFWNNFFFNCEKKNGKKFCDKINIVMKYRILKINFKKLLFREGCGMVEIWDIEDKKN